MGIVRCKKSHNYTTMSNYHLRDKRISLKAWGLMSWMLSLPDEWDFTISGIVACTKDGKDSVRSALSELEKAGYLIRDYERDENGRYDVNYTLLEEPERKNRHGKSDAENPTQINTKETNTENKKSEKNKFFSESEALPLKLDVDILETEENKYIFEALQKYVSECSKKGIRFQKRTIKKFAQLLKEEAGENPVVAMQIVNQSLDRGWKRLYKLKSYSRNAGDDKIKSIPFNPDNLARDDNEIYIVY